MIFSLLRLALRGYRDHKTEIDRAGFGLFRRAAVSRIDAAARKGDYEGALKTAERLKGNADLTADRLYFTANMLMNIGRYGEAEKRLRKHVTTAPDRKRAAQGHSSLGKLMLELGRYNEAEECFDISSRYWPDRGSTYRERAEVCLRRGNESAEALRWGRMAVEEDRERLNGANNAGQREAGITSLAEDLATLAWAVAADSGDRDQVDQLLDEATRLPVEAVSAKAQIHCHAGRAYAAIGDEERSGQHFAAAVQVDPHGVWGRAARRAQGA